MESIQHINTIRAVFPSTKGGKAMAMKPRQETEFAQRLRDLRMKLGLSQTDLGKKTGVHYTHIGRYEAGRSVPTAETLKSLAEALGITTDYLMSGATTDIATHRLNDRELLARFQEVERLGDEDKAVVKKLLDAFLAMNQLKGYANRQAS